MKAGQPLFVVLSMGALGVLLIALSILLDERFHPSYLYSYVFWTGISVGSLGILMVHHLTGGRWGILVHWPLEAALNPLPLMGLLFIPIAFGLCELYTWARPEEVAHNELLQEKRWYLNIPFFLSRTAGYFIIWIGLGYWLNKWSSPRNRSEQAGRLQRLSAAGLILLVLTVSFAAIDWVMTVIPEWYSTIFGLQVGMSQTLGTMGFVVVCALLLSTRKPLSEHTSPERWQDLGNFLLMFVLVWTYLAFMQFITIWIADVPEEISWYLPRLQTSWNRLGWALVVLYFFAPFMMLLSRRAKRNRFALGFIATIILCAYWTDMFWLVMPNFRKAGFEATWTDFGTFFGIGGLWLAVFLWRLAARSAVAPQAIGTREMARHG
jgi:hypothetical protein